MQRKFNSNIHHRRSIRLRGYDYCVGGFVPPTRYAAGTKPAARQAGAYFITAVASQRECLFGEIVNGEMKLNPYGKIVQKWWDDIPIHFPNVETLAFVVMPNHIHGIIVIANRRGTVPVPNENQEEITHQGGKTPPLHMPTLGQIIAYFKYQSTKEINSLGGDTITKFWQRNYYEHIIRNEKEMDNIWKYIEANPSMWADDDENPLRTR